MIEAVRLRNFKRFRQLDLPFRPLTVLTGLNGAGTGASGTPRGRGFWPRRRRRSAGRR
mgnify:CR=1 FL=1